MSHDSKEFLLFEFALPFMYFLLSIYFELVILVDSTTLYLWWNTVKHHVCDECFVLYMIYYVQTHIEARKWCISKITYK